MVEVIDRATYEKVLKEGNVLIVLGATWCKDCVRIEPYLKELQAQYAQKLNIYKIDSGKEEELSAELNIRKIPTLIFYSNGIEVGERLVEPESKEKIDHALRENFSL